MSMIAVNDVFAGQILLLMISSGVVYGVLFHYMLL